MADSSESAEFAFDLFSDIAPLLALFGDQFARQFASESLTWIDHVILAMVPLGILTIITGAIRVQGPRIAKSFIGRARENRALVELELMSSTSHEVCELFNGNSIIRVIGKPEIAQFFIFPSEYNTLEAKYRDVDLSNRATQDSKSAIGDKSCGIHTLQSAVWPESGTREQRLMHVREYQSLSVQHMRRWVQRLTSCWKKSLSKEDIECTKSGNTKSLPKKDDYTDLGPPNLQLGLSSNHFEETGMQKRYELLLATVVAVLLQASLIAIATVTVYHLPTKNAIGVEPKSYGFPSYIVGSILLSMGIGLCSLIVERNTVESEWTLMKDYKPPFKKTSRKPTSKGDREKNTYPRLLWLQRFQNVSDQRFDGYAILAGPKRNVVTSSRRKITNEAKQKRSVLQSESEVHVRETAASDFTKGAPFTIGATAKQHTSKRWEFLAVCGVLSAATGFIAQFMGLRGLAYPCSIAQLLAILAMAFIRALIRRRLGKIPAYCPVIADYELDFLATQIVFRPGFREYSQNKHVEEIDVKSLSQMQWRIRSPLVGHSAPLFLIARKNATGPTEGATAPGINNELPSSQQLVRVRERVGNLSRWPSKALRGAQSLALSIEIFMNTYLPAVNDKQSKSQSRKKLDVLDWVLDTNRSPTTQGPDSVLVSVQRSHESGKWQVDIGQLEAILSLWMASIETASASKESKPNTNNTLAGTDKSHKFQDWRYDKSGDDPKYEFCRILGDNFEDGTLKRDIAWWVDDLIAEQSDLRIDDSNADARSGIEIPKSQTKQATSPIDTVEHSTSRRSWHQSDASKGETRFIIGYNGQREIDDIRSQQANWVARELAIKSTANLTTILAQHLFTNFMWTVVDVLPANFLHQGYLPGDQEVDIEGSQTIDPSEFERIWSRARLRHRGLTKAVRKMETLGLGSSTEILLCMVPALSYKDLLPNLVMLSQLPRADYGQGWTETARCYSRLLETSIKSSPGSTERFCYNVVVAAMDFLSFACEPYDQFIKPAPELCEDLEDIVARLVSTKFVHVVKQIAPAYGLQHRQEAFKRIFTQFGTEDAGNRLKQYKGTRERFHIKDGLQEVLAAFQAKDIAIARDFVTDTLGFSNRFFAVYRVLQGDEENFDTPPSFASHRIDSEARDIFGWTPVHYASLVSDWDIRSQLLSRFGQNREPFSLHKLTDTLGRSPIHVAATGESPNALPMMLQCFSDEDKKIALNSPGRDGMTPLHLATKSGSLQRVKQVIDSRMVQINVMHAMSSLDVWGRQAIHLAASLGHGDIASLLLRGGTRIDWIDEIGNSPLDYIFKDGKKLEENQTPEQDGQGQLDQSMLSNTSPDDNHSRNESPESVSASTETHISVEKKRKLFEDFALSRPEYTDNEKKTFLHRAAERTDRGVIENLLDKNYNLEARDHLGRTPLHLAILAGRSNIALSLLHGIGKYRANPLAVDNEQGTALIFAAGENLLEVVQVLLGSEISNQQRNGVTRLEEQVGRSGSDTYASPQERPVRDACDPLARNSSGQTALHVALSKGSKKVVPHLLQMKDSQVDPRDANGVSLLITACQRETDPHCIRAILDKWSYLLNEPDPDYGETPLWCACEQGSAQIIDVLIQESDLQPNIPDTMLKKTPLHVAALDYDSSVLESLLKCQDLDLGMKDISEKTALDSAIARRMSKNVRRLLLDGRTPVESRISCLKTFCQLEQSAFGEIILDVFAVIVGDGLGNDDLCDLVQLSGQLETPEPYATFVKESIQRGILGQIKYPLHKAARFEDLELLKLLIKHGVKPEALDEDGWSCLDYATTYLCKQPSEDVVRLVQQNLPNGYTKPKVQLPDELHLMKLGDILEVTGCTAAGHKQCVGTHEVKVNGKGLVDGHINLACIRARNCLPPLSPTTKEYYYEVHIKDDCASRALGLGFCNANFFSPKELYLYGEMPGWYFMSWGYHGDDGRLFVNNGEGDLVETTEPSSHFGAPGRFSSPDVVGVGINLETGEGFVTLNGEKRNVGNAFEYDKFKGTKIYPCIGFDTTETGAGLRFQIVFKSSKHHRFQHKDYQDPSVGLDKENLHHHPSGVVR